MQRRPFGKTGEELSILGFDREWDPRSVVSRQGSEDAKKDSHARKEKR